MTFSKMLVALFSSCLSLSILATDLTDLTRRAEQGELVAQTKLAAMYYAGQGVKQDYREAAKWHSQAAFQNHAEAQFRLAMLYEDGRGVVKDMAQAVKWYQKSANNDFAKAKVVLGILYAQGKGVT